MFVKHESIKYVKKSFIETGLWLTGFIFTIKLLRNESKEKTLNLCQDRKNRTQV